MLSIEFEPASESICGCCYGMGHTLTRFVYKNGMAHAIYYAYFNPMHSPRVSLAIGLGTWTGEASDLRQAFAVELWANAQNYQVTFVDAADCPWQGSRVLGVMLDREQALAHPMCA